MAEIPRDPGDMAYRASSSSSLLLPPEFVQDPSSYLMIVATEPPSQDAMKKIAGPVASWFSNPTHAQTASQVASLYLKAAATQLKLETAASGSSVAAARKATRGSSGRMDDMELIHIQNRSEVIEAVGVAATHCIANRISISSSGILPILAQMMLNAPNMLQSASVEFLQCALLAEQYRYAARLLQGTWPRPGDGSSVKQVLRYYYLRGMVHLGCDDLVMAHRCFWTCLSIPSDSLSKITFEAWKKMVLVQCLMSKKLGKVFMRTPKSMPNVMVKLLSSYKDVASSSTIKPKSSARAVSRSGDITADPGQAPEETTRRPSESRRSQRLDQTTAQEAVAAYLSLVEAFGRRDKTKFETIVKEKSALFVADSNAGLVKQCLTQLVRNQVIHLSSMYSVIPVAKVVSMLGLEDDSKIRTLLLDSKVPCQLEDDNMVVFEDTTNSSLQTTKDPSLVDFSEWMELMEKVQQLDIAMVTSPKYHALLQKENAARKAGATAMGEGPRGVEDL